jgi:hypothetical protein
MTEERLRIMPQLRKYQDKTDGTYAFTTVVAEPLIIGLEEVNCG